MKTFLFLCMHITLFDSPGIRENLLPFTYTRPVAEIRIGILTISEKWQKRGFETNFETASYLKEKYGQPSAELKVNGSLCPSDTLIDSIKTLKEGEALVSEGEVLAVNGERSSDVEYSGDHLLVKNVWDIFKHNRAELTKDFKLLTDDRVSQKINDPYTKVYGAENLFVEEGAVIKAAIINAENGPVYIGKNAQVHEGSIINGSFALCEGSHVNMGAKIKGDSTIGPHSKIGGEVSNSVIFGYSNKAHDGFLGNSVIGEWCNLGADTNTSNLKNNYALVKLWNYAKGGFSNTGEQFCGLMMGDHSKCGINTMLNTGTVVGVGANIFGAGFPRNFVPSFSWGGANGFTTFQLRKFKEVAQAVMARRGKQFDSLEEDIIKTVFEESAQYRIWEKK